MPTEPKPDSPQYYWLCHALELQAIVDVNDSRYDQVFNLLYQVDQELLVVADFCAVEPGNPEALTDADFTSGTWKDKYLQAARQAAFYRLCEDV